MERAARTEWKLAVEAERKQKDERERERKEKALEKKEQEVERESVRLGRTWDIFWWSRPSQESRWRWRRQRRR